MPAPRHQLVPFFFIALFFLVAGEGGVNVLARSSSLPLIQTLLDHGPLKEQMAARHELSLQHLRFMLELYRRSADGHGRPRANHHAGVAVRLVRPIRQASPVLKDSFWHMKTLKFSLQGVTNAQQLVKATIMHPVALFLGNAHFSCKMGLQPDAGTAFRSRVRAGNRIWAEADLTTYLKTLMNVPRKTLNIYLQLICIKAERRPINVLEVTNSHTPFLLLYFNHTLESLANEERIASKREVVPGLRVRKSRQAGTIGIKLPKLRSQNGQSKNQCVLRPFWVSFHQLGWDHWIIAPHRYNPGYCKGDCPRLLHAGYNSPNHAIIQNFINQVVDGNVPRPSCVPYAYGPISVLMIEPGGNILYKEYENMMAQSCTCR
ncbi:bone morphogenetic protein 15 [Bombina bombina]|uniref:bone morphogenetic protein 15 n=1 Tax=Bombina bombina TaxID=8345 RepID=UPI00235ABF8D|nr:bone morphogenetic protein 15 [Bombina bombina]